MAGELKQNTGIYTREYKLPEGGAETSKKVIRVVPSAFWIMLIGGFLLAGAFLGWAIRGTIVKTVDATGLYHPGAATCGEVISFVPLADGKTVEPGMPVTLYPAGYEQQEYGHMEGTVTYVEPYVTSVEGMREYLGDDTLVQAFAGQGPVVAVVIELQKDGNTQNGYAWSNRRGGSLKLNDGTMVSLMIETETMSPIQYAFPDFNEDS